MADTRLSSTALATALADNNSGAITPQDARDTMVSCHPEKVIQTGTAAGEPSASQLSGDLYLPNNGFAAGRWSGSAWAQWGPIFPFLRPNDSEFAWINQETASVSTTNGGIYLFSGTAAAADDLRIRKKTSGSAPYTVTAAFLPLMPHVDTMYAGLCFRQSSDGKLATFQIQAKSGSDAGLSIAATKWTDHNTFLADYTLTGSLVKFRPVCPIVWLRIEDNNTNRICSISVDGQNFMAVHSVTRTDHLTADEVGFFVNANNASYAAAMTLLSWKHV